MRSIFKKCITANLLSTKRRCTCIVVQFFGTILFVAIALAQTEVPVLITSDLKYPIENVAKCLPPQVNIPVTEERVDSWKQCIEELAVFESISIDLPGLEGEQIVRVTLTPKRRIARISVSKVAGVSKQKLSRASELQVGDWFSASEIEAAPAHVQALLKTFGYHEAAVSVSMEQFGDLPLVGITIEIDKGYLSQIESLQFSESFPAELAAIADEIERIAIGLPATEKNYKELVVLLRNAVRQEGYLQASVDLNAAHYNSQTGNVALQFAVSFKRPISIFFFGNSFFSAEELLALLRLESRPVPFTPNAVRTFRRLVEENYRQQGFLDAEAALNEREAVDKRRVFDITINEGERYYLSAVRIKGNEAVSSKTLSEQIESSVRSQFFSVDIWGSTFVDMQQLTEDAKRIERWYQSHGYADAVVQLSIKKQKDSNDATAVFSITEGKSYTLKALKIRWRLGEQAQNAWGSSDLLIYDPEANIGDTLTNELIVREQQRITELLLRSGHPSVTITTAFDEESGTLTLILDPGIQTRVGSVVVQGNILTQNRAIERELVVVPGERWDAETLLKTQQNLYGMGIFRSVNLQPLDSVFDEPTEDIAVTVVERETGSVSGGIAYDTVDGVHLRGELAQRNFNGTGNRLSLAVDGYLRSQVDAGHGRIQYATRRVFNSESTMLQELFGMSAVRYVDQFSFDRFGYRLSVRSPLSETLSIASAGAIYSESVYDVDPLVIIDPIDIADNDILDFGLSVDYDLRDDRHNPRSGLRTLLRGDLLSAVNDSDFALADFSAQQSIFLPLTTRLVWANNLRLRVVENVSTGEVVPVNHRLFLGGRESLRGYGRYTVSPRAIGGTAIGGDRSFDGSSEFRLRVYEQFILVGFLDYGVSYLRHRGTFAGDALNFSDFHYAPGLGVSYETPVGPLSVEYGYALDRDETDKSGRFAVSIGSRF